MNSLEKINVAGLVPVVVIENADDAVPAAQALMEGGLDVMEITMRTAAGIDAIKNVATNQPEMLVGAGTILTLDKCKAAVDAGAQFIVSPGFNEEIVSWCIDHNVAITPGCVTPTEIELALSYGLNTLKFFPADVYGGVKACKALYGPYKSANVSFIPTGGVNLNNLAEYVDQPFIFAIGGGWLCPTADIANHRFEAITKNVVNSIDVLLGFDFAHLGINQVSRDVSLSHVEKFNEAFHFMVKVGSSSNVAGGVIEITNEPYLGEHGHIAIRTNNIKRAIYYLEKRGFTVDESTAKHKGNTMIAIYLNDDFSGFAVHLLQK